MAQPHSTNFLVTSQIVDQLACSILDNIGKAIPAQHDRHSATGQKPGPLAREPSRGAEVVPTLPQKAAEPATKAAIEALFSVKVRSVYAPLMKGKVKRSRGFRHGKFTHADGLSGSKRVNAGVQAKVRHVVQHQLEENVHAAVRQALERVDVHIVSSAELELLAHVKRIQLQRSQERIETVVELLLDGYDPTTATIAKIDQQNAEARARFIKEIKTMTSLQLAEMNGHTAKNAAQTANRWKSKDRIFGVPFQGQNLFPAFQFRDGQPLQVIADILGVLPPDMTEWQIAFWFVSSNPWLDGKVPYHCLDEQAKVIEAAKQEGLL